MNFKRMEWIKLSDREQQQILTQVGEATNLPENAIEKDWWVTVLKFVCFTYLPDVYN